MLYLFLRRFLVAPLVKLLFRPKVTGVEHVPTVGPALIEPGVRVAPLGTGQEPPVKVHRRTVPRRPRRING